MIGYVAFLDVLGFSRLVMDGSESGVARYFKCLKQVREVTQIEYVVFSDSIVLTVEGETPEKLVTIARACSQLLREMLALGIAMRGAIAFGEFLRETVDGSVFVAGRAVIDAFDFEQVQDWVGTMIAPSARQRVHDLKDRCWLDNCTGTGRYDAIKSNLEWSACIQYCPSIPFHSDSAFNEASYEGFAIVPTSGTLEPEALRSNVAEAIARLDWLRSIAPDPAAQRKYREAMNWLDQVRGRWESVAAYEREELRRAAEKK